MSIDNSLFFNAFLGISRRCDTASGNPLLNRFSSVFYRTEIKRKKERKRSSKLRGDRTIPSPFCRRSVAVCHFSYGSFFVLNLFVFGIAILQLCYGSLCSLEEFLGCEDFEVFSIMSYRRSKFMETDDMFLQFEDDLDNIAGGSSSVGDNTDVCVRKTFPVCCLKWTDVGREYIERLFVLDFNDQAMNRFVEHQMLTTFKEFRVDCHRHFKKYSDQEEARANPPNA
ncbi:CACTA en-spm transposon protein [Cucumis melo var. makuwa]|uniref:CACTA en-spm transposon protein n=1 Tax=Cucumis melo var. makuwa TaxID=1194695 RepID=A0A5D3CDY7_CUCMM|nr:CACTA en-spm transposon protein [Cucumis melo var. makuwa]